jgi:hypothetical protein
VHGWIHCTGNRYFCASDDAESGLGQDGSNLNDAFFSTAAKKMRNIYISCKEQCRRARKLSAVGTLEFFTVLTTYNLDLCKGLHYEGGIFIQKLYSALKMFMTEAVTGQDSAFNDK